MDLTQLLSNLNRHPVVEPQLTQLLVQDIFEVNLKAGPKAQAFDTPFRHSDAGSCSRRLGFKALGVPDSDPFDLGSTWVAWVGTMVHEHWQKAVERVFPDAEAEVAVTSDIASGHLDMLIHLPGQTITFELKTVNGFKYSKAIGVDKSHFRRLEPEGPSESHVIQTALNAAASGSDLMVIGYLAMESLSKKCAEIAGFSLLDRILSEWTYTPEQFLPIAEGEQERMRRILGQTDSGTLPAGDGYEKGKLININPNSPRPHWSCTYCSHRSVCERLPVGNLSYGSRAVLVHDLENL